MITCDYAFLIERAASRGYSLDEVMACVVEKNGDEWTIDVDHPDYPREPKPDYVQPVIDGPVIMSLASPENLQPAPPEEGPGTELKALLSKVGITATPTCSCNTRAMEMNRQGVQWCKDNEELILGWLKEESEKRGLPFVKFGARILLRRAIRNAEKKAKQTPKAE